MVFVNQPTGSFVSFVSLADTPNLFNIKLANICMPSKIFCENLNINYMDEQGRNELIKYILYIIYTINIINLIVHLGCHHDRKPCFPMFMITGKLSSNLYCLTHRKHTHAYACMHERVATTGHFILNLSLNMTVIWDSYTKPDFITI